MTIGASWREIGEEAGSRFGGVENQGRCEVLGLTYYVLPFGDRRDVAGSQYSEHWLDPVERGIFGQGVWDPSTMLLVAGFRM